jgi:probable aminopeptidase NPEPL1
MPASELHTDSYVEEIEALVRGLDGKVTIAIKKGETLNKEGFGGLWGVGKAAEHLPALVHLSYSPPTATKTVVMVCLSFQFAFIN